MKGVKRIWEEVKVQIKLKEAKQEDIDVLVEICFDTKDTYTDIMPEAFENRPESLKKMVYQMSIKFMWLKIMIKRLDF